MRRRGRRLTRHVGGAPNDIQRVLIERASRLMVYIETMDAQALEDGTMSERNSRQYLAWTNSLRLTLRELGLKAAPAEKLPDLSDIVAEHGTAPMSARAFSILDAVRDQRLFGKALARSLDVAGVVCVPRWSVRAADVGGAGRGLARLHGPLWAS